MRHRSTRIRSLAGVAALLLSTCPLAQAREAPAATPAAEGDGDASYQQAVLPLLLASKQPRDWLLAAHLSMGKNDGNDTKLANPQELLRKAAEAAPDDALVQWFWANNGVRAEPTADRAAALRRIEPDNAAAWTFDLARATRQKDEAGIDAALAHMAAATREDVHWVDTTRTWNATLQHLLTDAKVRAAAKRVNSDLTPEALATTLAMSMSSSFALPAYQNLVRACDAAAKPAPGAERLTHCAATGRLMVAHGNTFASQNIGGAVLRKSGQINDEDRRQLREISWIMAQSAKVAPNQPEAKRGEAQRFEDWTLDEQAGDREIDWWKQRLPRHGIALTPPPDWVSPRDSYDAKQAAKAAAKSATSEKQ